MNCGFEHICNSVLWVIIRAGIIWYSSNFSLFHNFQRNEFPKWLYFGNSLSKLQRVILFGKGLLTVSENYQLKCFGISSGEHANAYKFLGEKIPYTDNILHIREMDTLLPKHVIILLRLLFHKKVKRIHCRILKLGFAKWNAHVYFTHEQLFSRSDLLSWPWYQGN